MGFTSFIARIEPNQQAYVSGQVVTGCLYATVDSPTKCRAVIVSCKGKAKVHWREKVKDDYKNFDSSQEYFNIQTTHWQGDKIPAGTYRWPFQFVLPAGFPSSFEGSKGWVRYYLKAKADIPFGFDDESKIYFSYSNQDDLNFNSVAMKPLVINQTDTSCCFPCKEGPVTLNFNCKRSGAVIGENFKIRGEISNDGTTTVSESYVALKQRVVFRAGGRTKSSSQEIARVQRGAIQPGESDFYDDANLFIPAVAPSLINCRIIDLTYTLKFHVDTGSCGSVSKTVNFTIGTVPFKVEGASIAIPAGPPSQFSSPAPPPYAPPQNMHLAANYPSAPSTIGGYAPPPSDGGYVPPPKDGRSAPPSTDVGYVPPPKDGECASPSTNEASAPPPNDEEYAPPSAGGYAPPPSGYGPPPPVGFNAVSAPPPPMMPAFAPAVTNPYPLTGPPKAEACFICARGGYRLDKNAPAPTYLSYRTVMTYN